MVYDSDYREAAQTGLETATPLVEQGADTLGAFIVPTNVSRITEIRIGVHVLIAADAAMGMTSSIHMYGGGIVLGEGWFPGPVMTIAGHATGSGGIANVDLQKYLVNIPVKPGGQFNVDAFMLGEDVGAAHFFAGVVYDGPVVGKIKDMDYRSIDLTAANGLVTLTERGAAVVEGDMKPAYGKIGEIFLGAAAKETAAATTGVGLAFHLSGPGLLAAGNYKFLGEGWTLQDDVNVAVIKELTHYRVNIPVKTNNPIRVQGQMLEADVGTAFSILGFGYY